MATKNLGLVKAVHVGTNAPANTLMQWLDTSTPVPVRKDFNPVAGVWVAQLQGTAPAGATKYVGLPTLSLALTTNFLGGSNNEAEGQPAPGANNLARREFGSPISTSIDYRLVPNGQPIETITISNGTTTITIDPTKSIQTGTVVLDAVQNLPTTFTMTVITREMTSAPSQTFKTTLLVDWGYRHFVFASEENLLTKTDSEISAILRALPLGDSAFSLVDLEDKIERSKILRLQNPAYLYACYLSTQAIDFTINNLSNNAFRRKTFSYTGHYGQMQMTLGRNSHRITGTYVLGVI